MEQSKSPKSIAYSRLGKPHSGKQSLSEQTNPRKSTGNIYEDLIGEFDPQQERYIRDLVNKNVKESQATAFHGRKKSYADLEVQQPNVEDKSRKERETLCKSKPARELVLPQQATPKNSYSSQMTRSDFISRQSLQLQNQSVKMSCILEKGQDKLPSPSFINNLSSYLQELSQANERTLAPKAFGQKLSETLKISYGAEDTHKYASKIEQQMLKIKQLKLKNHCIQKQLAKRDKIESKMKGCLYEMLQQIKELTSELSKQKKERKRLQKVIENFELRNQQLERKTIGRNYNLSKIQEFQSQINQFTDNQPDKSELDSSFRELWKRPKTSNSKVKHPIYISQSYNPRGLDSTKIQKMFQSNYHSQDEQDDIYQ